MLKPKKDVSDKEEGFFEGDVPNLGTPIATFNFGMNMSKDSEDLLILRKLNELKAKHPDVNVYLNTIIDEAIVYYYNHIFNDGGNFNNA